MKIDFVSIFPDYFAPLMLSLPGKAQAAGLLEIQAHDLRAWAHDRHHTVDDTPYGGGAGMVMKPEPWGEAFDSLGITEYDTIIFTTPSGDRFDQRKAEELSGRPRLIFACGRYEGIDQRVIDYAREIAHVEEISLGDYVLNGGEVAALAITEAVVRLIPGFMGNPDSLVEESHSDGLLEYPSFTKPPTWRGREVPEVLLSGNHGAIQVWRTDQARRRTAQRRPDLLPAHALAEGIGAPCLATAADAGELLVLTRACFIEDSLLDSRLAMPQFRETVEDTKAALEQWQVWVLRESGRLIGSVRTRAEGDVWHLARVMVAPDLHGQGIGRALLAFAEARAPESTRSFVLEAASANRRNQRFYKKAGYRSVAADDLPVGLSRLCKTRR